MLNIRISMTRIRRAPIKSGCGGQASIPLQTEDAHDDTVPTRLSPDFTDPFVQTAVSLWPGEGAPAVRTLGSCLGGCGHPRSLQGPPPAACAEGRKPLRPARWQNVPQRLHSERESGGKMPNHFPECRHKRLQLIVTA